jgi:2-keto-4-pentenoate hydratase
MQDDGEPATIEERTDSTVPLAPEAARLLVDARRTGTTLSHLPEHLRPASQADAHRIQDAIVARLGTVGGWKIFAGDDAAPFLSPVPGSLIFHQGHAVAPGPLPIVLVELEIAVTLARDLPARSGGHDPETVRGAIASLHPLLELITFSWTDREQVDRLTQLSDLQNSAGFVVGAPLADWAGIDPGRARATLILDGVEHSTASDGADMATILRTLALLSNHAAARGMPLRRGQVVTTGARLVAPTRGVKTIRGQISGLGEVRTTLG